MSLFGSILSTTTYPSLVSEVVTPTTGQSITISLGTTLYAIVPAGTLVALTVTMPAAPTDGQMVFISSSQAITGLTLSANSGQSILNVPTTLALGASCGYCYVASQTKWFRIS